MYAKEPRSGKKGETIEANSLRTVYRLGAAETHFKTEAAAAGAHKETLDRGRRALTFLTEAAEAGAAKVAAAASSRRLRRDCTKSCVGHLERTFLALEAEKGQEHPSKQVQHSWVKRILTAKGYLLSQAASISGKGLIYMWTWQCVNTTTRDKTGSLVAAAFFFDTITAYMV